jgi:hypothetical protein
MIVSLRISFVRAVLDLYLGLPHSAARRPSRNDRRLNEHSSIALFPSSWSRPPLLATLRRAERPLDTLPPVRSLHHFVPVIDELLASPPDPGYLRDLQARLRLILNRSVGHSTTVPDGR